MRAAQRWLVIFSVLAVLAPVGVMMLVSVTPTPQFDVDPRSIVDPATGQPLAQTMMGPAGAAWWHVWAVAASAFAIAVSLRAGARLQRWACVLAGLGMAAAGWQMSRAQPNGLNTGAWIAAASLGLAAAHITQLGVGRRWLAAGLIALLVPLALDAGWYLAVEHPATVANFEQHRAEALAARGWEEGSTQAELFERRLRSADAVGAIGLSNVLGSVTAALTLLAAGVAVSWAGRRRPGMLAAMAGLVLAGLATVWMTRSKGAILALAPAAVLLGLGWWAMRRRRGGRWLALAAVALPMAAVVGVLLRASLGAPDSWEGERSLLFRWYYWQGAWRAMNSVGVQAWLLGVGPAPFKNLYGAVKPVLSPEEVTNTHNVFFDYVTLLGLGGLAWAALLLTWLVAAARCLPHLRATEPVGASAAEPPRAALAAAAALAVVVFGTEYRYTIDAMVIESALVWLIGALGFVGVMAGLAQAARPRWIGLGLLAAAAVLLMHNQIEMTFYHWSASLLGWTVVGAAGGLATAPRRRRSAATTPAAIPTSARPWRYAAPAGLVVLAIVLVVGHAAPTQARQARLAAAAAALQRNAVPAAVQELDAASDRWPTDPLALRWRVILRLEAAQVLDQAGRSTQARQLIAAAREILAVVPPRFPDPATIYRMRSQLEELAGNLPAAADARRHAVQLQPQSLPDRLALADLLTALGDPAAAAEHYRAALTISADSYLDPAKQLPPAQAQTLRARLDAFPTPDTP